jgi:type I restriction enzyme S subunit
MFHTVRELQNAGILLVEDGNHGEYRPLPHEFVAAGTPFVRPDDLKEGRVDFSACDHINDEAVARLRKGHGQPGDTLFTHRATVGRMALVRNDDPPFVANPGVTVWRSLRPEVIHPKFLYYRLHARDVSQQVWAVAGSSDTFPYVSLTEQRKLRLSLPSHHTQLTIASILGSLDDKIDLNRRMNETLEAIARAIFKDWFVDFGPTCAKMEGRAPYLAPEIWSLFPDRLDHEGKPEGWKIATIGDIADRVAMGPFGSNIKVETFVKCGIPIISGQHLRGTMLADTEFNFISEDHANRLANSNVRRGDIVFTHAGNIGQVAIIPETSRYERYVLSQRQFFLRCDSNKASPLFVTYFFKSPDGQHKLLANASQVGVPSIARPATNLRTIEFCIPSIAVMNAFDSVVRTKLLKCGTAIHENEVLTSLRDLLIPRLMSGGVRVRDD